jgi:hypothetical protein
MANLPSAATKLVMVEGIPVAADGKFAIVSHP